jgi:hypothetical protein
MRNCLRNNLDRGSKQITCWQMISKPFAKGRKSLDATLRNLSNLI